MQRQFAHCEVLHLVPTIVYSYLIGSLTLSTLGFLRGSAFFSNDDDRIKKLMVMMGSSEASRLSCC